MYFDRKEYKSIREGFFSHNGPLTFQYQLNRIFWFNLKIRKQATVCVMCFSQEQQLKKLWEGEAYTISVPGLNCLDKISSQLYGTVYLVKHLTVEKFGLALMTT